nr:phage head-tail connector protein [Clostridium chrysemydis]
MFLTDVKILLQIKTSDCSKDELLSYLIRQVKIKILNYCNIQEIPLSHQYLIPEMVASYYNLMYKPHEEEQVQTRAGSKVIKKESIGDYSVEYDTGEASKRPTPSSADTSNLESVLIDYKSELNQIRKLRL